MRATSESHTGRNIKPGPRKTPKNASNEACQEIVRPL